MNPRQPAPPAPTYELLGVNMSVLNIPDAVRRILDAVKLRQRGYVCVTGVHGIMESRTDKSLREILNSAFLCTPDGMPTVWMGRISGHKSMARVYGPDLMLAVMEATRDRPVRHFFYGGQDGVAEDLKQKLEARYPGLQVCGTYCPPFRPLNDDENKALQAVVASSGADIVWIGLSTPKQERFMSEQLAKLDTCILIGVGAAFDFHTGRVRQAPRWIQRSGLEWLYRVFQEPRRLWRRYFGIVPKFILLVAASRLLGRQAYVFTGGLLFRWLPRLLALGTLSTIAGAILHPPQAALIIGAGLGSLLATIISGVLAMGATEEEQTSVIPALPWLAASAAVVLSAFGSWLGRPVLLWAGLITTSAALLFWLGLIGAAVVCASLRKPHTAPDR